MKQGDPRLETRCICTPIFPFLTPHRTLLTCPALKSYFETPAYVCAQRHKHRGRALRKAVLLQHFVLFHDMNVLLCVLLPTGCGRSHADLGCSLAKSHTEIGEIAKRESWPQLFLCAPESHNLGRLCAHCCSCPKPCLHREAGGPPGEEYFNSKYDGNAFTVKKANALKAA